MQILKQCFNPYTCPFVPYCWEQAGIPEYSVYDLTGIREAQLQDLLDRGILLVEDVPADAKLTPAQKAQVQAARTG